MPYLFKNIIVALCFTSIASGAVAVAMPAAKKPASDVVTSVKTISYVEVRKS